MSEEFTAEATGSVLLNTTGHLAFLRAHEVGSGYGPSSDFIDVEAVFGIKEADGMAFGFQLRGDDGKRLPARQAMFDLLRDAFNHNWKVSFDYSIVPGKKNGVILRTWLLK